MVWLYDVGSPADSVELLPTDTKDTYVSIATYLYDKDNKTRSGDLRIAKVSLDQVSEIIDIVQGPGVLDVKWTSCTDGICNGIWARSDGSVSVGVFDLAVGKLRVQSTFDLDPESITMACDMNDGLIAAAMSSGAVILCTETGKMHTLKGHSLEAWTVSFDPHQPNILHSGGDDAKWRGWDLRSRDSTFTCSWHTAGVCSIQPHRTDANLIVTGSYDKYAALWDQRTLRQPVQTTKADSGVWKLKWHPSNDMRILAACMYDGFYVFDMEFARIHSKYDPQALSYGCAWLNDTTAVTCSFYNHQVQLWKVE